MEFAFYLSAIVAVLSTLRVITHTNAVHALLYLIVSLLAVAVAFYALGAPFAAVLEVIVYAGAIMVLFIFVVMMLNLNAENIEQERRWLESSAWAGPAVLTAILLLIMIITLWGGEPARTISGEPLMAKEVGMLLFGPYLLVVELASFLLLAALVVAAHVGRDDTKDRDVTRDEHRRARRARSE